MHTYVTAVPADGARAKAMLSFAVGPLFQNLDLRVHARLAGGSVVAQARHYEELHCGAHVHREVGVALLCVQGDR